MKLNFGKTAPGYFKPPVVHKKGPEFYFEPLNATTLVDVTTDETLNLFIKILAPPEVFGVAFEVEFDTATIRSAFSHMGQLNTPWLSSRFFNTLSEPGVLPFALARAQPDSILANGKIAIASLRTKSVFPANLPDSIPVRFRNIRAIRSDGTVFEMEAYIPHHYIKAVVAATEKRKLGFT